ncbi:hypothetical protein ABMB67_003541 [Halalkalibacter oceani]
MSKRPFELWLIWQNVETRQRYHVGRLLHEDGGYTFSYEKEVYLASRKCMIWQLKM